MNDLKPCPFCGSKDIRIVCHLHAGRGMFHLDDDIYSIGCFICGASVPSRYEQSGLIKDWNKRTNLTYLKQENVMKFRKKPVVIEAIQIPESGTMLGEPFFNFLKDADVEFNVNGSIDINTEEGIMRGSPHDWIIKGVKGEFYPCKPDIFAATYDPVDDSTAFTNYDQFRHLESLVVEWADNKGILVNGTPEGQANKTIEEATEILTAIQNSDQAEISDGIGDTLVTLIIQAKLQNMDILECLQDAYNIIAKRTGQMVDGVFVKDGR